MESNTTIYEIASVLDPSDRVPLYEQLATAIHEGILSRRIEPGSVLPPEPEMAARIGVSRQTVNQALTMLARNGLLRRRRGVGTFVAEPFIEQPLGQVYSFIRTITAQGRNLSTRLLGYRVMVDGRASMLLTGTSTGLLSEFQRLLCVDGDPFAFETFLIPRVYGEKLPPEMVANEPIYDVLLKCCGLRVTRGVETLQPVSTIDPEATLLGVPPGEAAFLVERTTYVGEEPIEFRRSLIRGDRFRFRVDLSASGLNPAEVTP